MHINKLSNGERFIKSPSFKNLQNKLLSIIVYNRKFTKETFRFFLYFKSQSNKSIR